MSFTDSMTSSGDSLPVSERRQHTRQAPRSLSYVHLDEANGGILLNVSEGGLAVQAAMSVMEDFLPRVRLQVAQSKTRLEGSARVVWTGDSGRIVGIEFTDFADESRKQLREWLGAEAAGTGHSTKPDVTPLLSETRHPRVEDVPLRRVPAALHVPEIAARSAEPSSTELDVEALLAVREAVQATARRSAIRTQEKEAPAQPRPIAEPVAAKPPRKQKTDSRSRYVPVLAALAALSLVAGWEAGRGNVLQAFAALTQPSSAASLASRESASAQAVGVTAASVDFEIVDATNQSWWLPFSGPTSVPQGAPTPVLPPQPAPPQSRPDTASKRAFQLKPLAAPQSAARPATLPSAPQVAPLLPTTEVLAGTSVPSSIADGGVNLAPPSAAPSHSTLVPAVVARRVDPIYPTQAMEQRIEGTVKIRARVGLDGTLSDVTALSGSSLLTSAAIAAVQKWQYKPGMLDGHPIVTDIDISILFTLPQ